MTDFLTIYLTALLSGGFAIPLGFLLERSMLEIYLAAVLGSLTGMIVFAFVGGGIRSWLVKRIKNPEAAQERINRLLGKWGVKGLGLIGPIFPGVTVTVVVGLAAGVDRRELITWTSIGIVGLYAVYVIGLALLIEIFGI